MTEFTPKIVINDLKANVEFIEQQINNLIIGALEIISNCEKAKQIYQLLIGISGIAEKTAIKLIGGIWVLIKNQD